MGTTVSGFLMEQPEWLLTKTMYLQDKKGIITLNSQLFQVKAALQTLVCAISEIKTEAISMAERSKNVCISAHTKYGGENVQRKKEMTVHVTRSVKRPLFYDMKFLLIECEGILGKEIVTVLKLAGGPSKGPLKNHASLGTHQSCNPFVSSF